ncbi:MAG: DoxX family protein [Desertimonas sp.]
MALTDYVARPLAAGIFIVGGLDTLRNPDTRVPMAQSVTGVITAVTGITPKRLVQLNAAVQLVGGVAVASGRFARPAALAIAASLVPTTLAGHRFWAETEAMPRRMQRIQFLKNASMLGGMLSIASNTGGRPSLPWLARRAIEGVVDTSVDTVQRLLPADAA